MKVSVITVCYNSARTLSHAIQSVVDQDWPKVEHIIIDGGSTDGTADILERFRSRLAYVVSEPDRGVYDAMNKGVMLASGDVVGFLNADDMYASPGVLSQVARMMEAGRLDALLGDVEFFNPTDPKKTVRRYRSDQFSPDRIAWGWMPAHPALFLRRQVYERFGLFRTDYRIAGDFEYCARIFRDNTLVYRSLPEPLVRMRTGGISTGGWRNTVLLNQEVMRACRENGIETNMLKIFSKYPAKMLEFFVK